MDEKFGRARFFIVYDTETQSYTVVENPGCGVASGAGPTAVQLVRDQGAQVVLAKHIGPKARDVMLASGIEFYDLFAPTVKEAIESFLK